MKSLRHASSLILLSLALPALAEEESGPRDTPAAKPYDPMLSALPHVVVKTFHARFPGHRIWQIRQHGREDTAPYELIVFHPENSTRHGITKDGVDITTLLNHTLVVDRTGKVLREQSHSIPTELVPKKVRLAFEAWKKTLPERKPWVEWRSSQEEGGERRFVAYAEINSIESFGATFQPDGTFVKKYTDFKKR